MSGIGDWTPQNSPANFSGVDRSAWVVPIRFRAPGRRTRMERARQWVAMRLFRVAQWIAVEYLG